MEFLLYFHQTCLLFLLRNGQYKTLVDSSGPCGGLPVDWISTRVLFLSCRFRAVSHNVMMYGQRNGVCTSD
jgi:hypothetical protein